MAEIKVEPQRRSLAWLWILLLVLVVAAAVWYFVLGAPGLNTTTNSTPAAGNTTGVNGTTIGGSTGATSALWRPDFLHQEA